MKFKEIFYLLGFKPQTRTYGHDVRVHELPGDGTISFAHWQHPRHTPKEFPPELIAAYRRYIRPGDMAIDIGAHTGDSTLPMALAAGPQGTVLALEPNPHVFPILTVNASLNAGKVHIVPLQFAASAEDEEIDFEYSDAGYCNGGQHEGVSRWRHAHAFKLRVQCRNLPKYIAAHHPEALVRTRFIKVDTEGHDHAVLQTLAGLIDQARPYIKAEVYRHLSLEARRAFLQFLREHHYRVHRTRDDAHLEGELLTEENLLEHRHYDLFAVPQ